jgi:spore maturation protein CgeB
MKILLSGYHNPHYETVTEYMERAIVVLGHDLVRFDDRCHLIPGRIRYRVPWLRRWDLRVLNRRLSSLALHCGVSLVIATGGDRILGATIRRLKDRGVTTALWTTDPPHGCTPILGAAPFYDYIFCQGSETVDFLQANGIERAHRLPVGCEPESHHAVLLSPEEKEQYGHDVVFVGSWYPERAALFERLCDFDLAIWGPGWENLPSSSTLRRHLRGAHTSPDQWRKIYSASRIVLATHYHDPSGRYPVYQASPRVFEAMACGAFVLCDRQRDVLALFRDGEHLACFSDGDDLAVKVRYYLEHPGERQAIARKGREEVLANHTYVHRLHELIAVASGRLDRFDCGKTTGEPWDRTGAGA